jgi:hypothetical protein
MASLVLATLFFNFLFVESHDPPGLWLPLPLYGIFLVPVVAILTLLFFWGPAIACQVTNRPLPGVIEDSVGTIPAFAVRFCCALFLVFWISRIIAALVFWWPLFFRERSVSPFESGAVGTILLAFLFLTAHQAIRATSALALFTNKLMLALLLAAAIRVQEGWGATLVGHRWDGWYFGVWMGVSELALYMAPIGLIAAEFGYRIGSRRELALTTLWGAALPLLVTMLLVGLIRTATYNSSFYQPSLTPTVDMALWSHTAHSALGGRLLVAGVTVFGALRFASRSLTTIAGVRFPGSRPGLLFVCCVIGMTSWLALQVFDNPFQAALDWSGRCLGAMSAMITADLVTRKRRAGGPRAVDWIGLMSLAAGLATPLFVSLGSALFRSYGSVELTPTPSWWYLWTLPTYIVTFFVCSVGRLTQRLGVLL